MSRNRNKPIVGFSNDVLWYIPNRKKPIATSTVATSNSLWCLYDLGFLTPNEMFNAILDDIFLVGEEEKAILKEYINKGFGDLDLEIEWL